MSNESKQTSEAWASLTTAALRVAFGIIWVVNAAFTWTDRFAVNYVGYLHNAAEGQHPLSSFWFDAWIALVTPNAGLFIWLTRIAETGLAIGLLFGIARKSMYVAGALFSLLVWSTAEGFGGPYAVGATNMGTGLIYVLLFVALIAINSRSGASPYSLDYYIEKRWPFWRRIAEWRTDAPSVLPAPVSWNIQIPVLAAIALLVFFLVAGLHSSLNVKSASPEAAAAAVSPLALASKEPVAEARDATLPPLQSGNSAEVHMSVTDEAVSIASGVKYQAWPFNGTAPGPFIHVRQGQTVNVTLTNHGTMHHSIDFHAALTPPDLNFVDINPGESIKFSFVAKVPGAFLYHCGTPPVLLHIANGMFGAIIVDPATPLPPADKSYVLVQSEWYTQQISGNLMGPDYDKMMKMMPDEVVFNGVAFQYKDHPLTAEPNQRVRLYVVNAGPSLWSAFHVIGSVFDRVYLDGDPSHFLSGVSTHSVGPGEGMVFDVVIPQAGKYPIVDHSMAHVQRGAVAVLDIQTPGQERAAKPQIEKVPASASAAPMVMPAAAAAAGPYKFSPERGATLYASTCAACHQATGAGLAGVFPPLKGNAVVLDANPSKHIQTILHGLQGVAIDGVVYPSPMPEFGPGLSDADVADIANHERTSWGNQGQLVTADQVKTERAKGPAH